MHTVRIIAIGLLAWPAAEIVTFVIVAALLGVSTALFLMILISLAGLLILRHFGRSLMRLRAAAGGTRMAALTLEGAGVAPGVGGVLLVIPGFITGVLGVLVLFPVSRRWLLATCRHMFATDRRQSRPDVIDLAPGEWRPLSGSKLPPAGGQLDH